MESVTRGCKKLPPVLVPRVVYSAPPSTYIQCSGMDTTLYDPCSSGLDSESDGDMYKGREEKEVASLLCGNNWIT